MTENQKRLLELLKYQCTMDLLSEKLFLSPKQVYQRIIMLKNAGYNISRKDFEAGDVSFELSNIRYVDTNEKIIYTKKDSNILRCIVSSDNHLGNTYQNLDANNAMYNYAVKNDIHIILNCGDFLNGLIRSKIGKPFNNIHQEQLSRALKDYPYDPKIINYVCLGNHDLDFLNSAKIDLKNAIERKRFDIVPVGYETSKIFVKNEEIVLCHSNTEITDGVLFRGHSHISKSVVTDADKAKATIFVPTMSNLLYDKNYSFPSFLDVTFKLAQGKICNIHISQLIYVDKKVVKVNESVRTFVVPIQKDIKHEVDNAPNEDIQKKLAVKNLNKKS